MKKIIIFLFSFVLLFSFFVPLSSHALTVCSDETDPLGFGCLDDSGLGRTDPRIVVGRVINVSLGLLGTLFVGLTVYAGFLWMTAGGNEDQVGKAKKILYTSIIGLIIILSAYSISNFVLRSLYGASTGQTYGNVL